ncbi:MAG: hypothetical protein WD648_05640 [Planctomycetaceae bacterium]
MDLQNINVKVPVEGDLKVDPGRFIEVFHRWVANQVVDGELLIDVADYQHVPAGPGVVLVGLESDYSIDETDGSPGLRYNRKAPVDGTTADRLHQALAAAATACQLLETEFASEGPLKFSRRAFELFINDRALAPNTPETLAACKPELESFLTKLVGSHDFSLRFERDPRRRFGVQVNLAKPLDFAALQNATA